MLEKMYQLYNKEKEIIETTNKTVNQALKKEQAIYNTLCDCLSKKEKELLDEFIDRYITRHCENVEQAYKDGFTAGSLLMIEIFNKE